MGTTGYFHDVASEKLPLPALQVLQAEKLKDLLEKVTATNKFYKNKLRKHTLDTLQDLPFTTKKEIAGDQEKFPPFGSNLTQPLLDYCRFHQTSGSSGAPIRWLDTRENWDWLVRNWSFVFHAAGLKAKDRVCFAFSFGPFLGFWTAFDAASRYGALCFAAGGLSTSARLRFMLDNGITAVCCTPTYALRMAEVAAQEKINIALSPVRLLIVAGEPGGSVLQTREKIEQAWGARCIDHYGMTEIGPACFECEKVRGRLHVIESEYIAECIDPETTEKVADGEVGELVLTTLGRADSPLIRYRTGDLVRMKTHATPCACGRSFASFDGGILGRSDDMLVIRGVNIFPSALEEAIRRVASPAEFRVETQTVRAMLEVKIVVEPHAGDPADSQTAESIANELQKIFGIRMTVELVAPNTLPRFEMKSRRWIKVKDE